MTKASNRSNDKIPVTALVMTKNEAAHIEKCLGALQDFAYIIVVDSDSTDDTQTIAQKCGARVENFIWNGKYPKKRQWCLDNLDIKTDWIFFVDADESITKELSNEIKTLFDNPISASGYFIKSRYVIDDKIVRFGLQNNKIALFDRTQMAFPEVDDLHLNGMGEIEGHYQPVLKSAGRIGRLKSYMLHYAYKNENDWWSRHRCYAEWENGMNQNQSWPKDPSSFRQLLKIIFRHMPCRYISAFLHSYILKLGILDGRAGLKLAFTRYHYYRMISVLATNKDQDKAAE